jgi:phosphate-selective porin OprO/OprP
LGVTTENDVSRAARLTQAEKEETILGKFGKSDLAPRKIMKKINGFHWTFGLACAQLILLLFLMTTPVQAAELTPTERALLERIEALEKRIEELESRVPADANEPVEKPKLPIPTKPPIEPVQDPNQAPAEDLTLTERVEKLETAAAEAPQKSPYDLRAFWDKGLRLHSDDGNFKLNLGGRTAVDSAWFSDDTELQRAVGNQQDGIEFRRAYLYMSGLINGWIEYKSEYEFSGDQVGFEDVYVGFTKIPYLGKIRFGHIDEPFGLELRTSNRHTTFMERALTHAIIPGTNTGVLAKNLIMDDSVFFNFGIFRETDGRGANSGDGGYNVTGRLAAIPINRNDGTELLHFGISGSHRNPDDMVRFRSKPESNLSNFRYVDTFDFFADSEDVLGLEFAWINGPLSFQSEYVLDSVDTQQGGDANISAWYAFVSYILTGESRFYDLGSATFDRPRVNKSLREGGPGAWEVAARFSSIDLDDGSIRGGTQDDVTLGLNWYLNPNTKLMFNYIRALVDHDLYDGNLDIFQMRAQVDF